MVDDEPVEVEGIVVDKRVEVGVVDDDEGRHWEYHWLSAVHMVPEVQTVSPCSNFQMQERARKDGQARNEQPNRIGAGAGLTV